MPTTQKIIIKKKVGGDVVTLLPQTTSSLVTVGSNTLDTELSNIKSSIASSVPIGTIVIWFGDNYPSGWLPLDGQAISRTIYSDLFSSYGTTFGAGDGSTTFNLPNQNDNLQDYSKPSYSYIVKALSGTSIARSNAKAMPVLNTSSISTESNDINQSVIPINVPIGSVIEYASNGSIPIDWVEADGRELSRTEYADLFSAIGTTFGEGDSSTTFNIPNIEQSASNIRKIIKIKSNVNLINDITDSLTDTVSANIIKSLSDRIKILEDMIGI